mgnify:CR=1 FL=1
MTNHRFCRALNIMFPHEGGFVNHKNDPGGATKYGITHKTLALWRGLKSVSVQDVKNLFRSEAADIYKARYWDVCRCDDLPGGVAYAVYDFAVNSGPRTSIKHLQRSLGFVGKDVDGYIGGFTLKAVNRADPKKLINKMCDSRLSFMQKLRNWKSFGRGWSRRVKEVREKAIEFANLDKMMNNPIDIK